MKSIKQAGLMLCKSTIPVLMQFLTPKLFSTRHFSHFVIYYLLEKVRIPPTAHAHRERPCRGFYVALRANSRSGEGSTGSSLSFAFSSPQHRLKSWIIILHHACASTAEQTHEYANSRPLSFSRGRTTQSARMIAPLLTPSQHFTNIIHSEENTPDPTSLTQFQQLARTPR